MAAPPPTIPSVPQDSFPRLCALLRDIRAEAQDLARSLADIAKKGTLTDPQVRAQEIASALNDAAGALHRNRIQIEERLAQIRSLFSRDARQYDWCGDEVTDIENCWARVLAAWAEGSPPVDEILRRCRVAGAELDQIVYHCAALTIASRLDVYLGNLRAGQTLDFHRTFADELPQLEHRVKVLEDLARQPGVVQGFVDVPSGLVYRASPSAWRRRLSMVLIAVTAAAGFLLVWVLSGMGAWLSLDGWPVKPSQFGGLAVAYLFLLLGSLVHLVVNALKQSRSASAGNLVALQDWGLWLHVHETAMITGILYLWVGFFVIGWSTKNLNWQTAFFVGYSIDSLIDLFLDRFQRIAGTQTEQIKKDLAPSQR